MKTPEDSISATEIKNNFGECLQTVLKKHKPILIEKHGKPAAVLVEFEKWKTMQEVLSQSSELPWVQGFEKLIEKIKKNSSVRPTSSVDIIKKARQEGY